MDLFPYLVTLPLLLLFLSCVAGSSAPTRIGVAASANALCNARVVPASGLPTPMILVVTNSNPASHGKGAPLTKRGSDLGRLTRKLTGRNVTSVQCSGHNVKRDTTTKPRRISVHFSACIRSTML